MWHLQTDNGERRICARDETLRDGNQGEVPRSAFRAVAHVIDMCGAYDMMSLGWIYVNPADMELAKYLREHDAQLLEKNRGYEKEKFFVYALVHRGQEDTPDAVIAKNRNDIRKAEAEKGNFNPSAAEIESKLDGFSNMLLDLQSGKQPYGVINILTKARASDLKDFGEHTTSASFRKDIVNTMRLLHQANPAVGIEIALEHVYTAWLEQENQQANRQHIVDTLVDYLLETGNREQSGITLPDTDGAHKPAEIKQVIAEVTAALQSDKRLLDKAIRFEPEMLVAHMHDDLGNAGANTKAALEAGAGGFDSTAGIFGERKGNCTAAEATRVLDTSNAEAIRHYQPQLENILGIRQGDKPVGAPEAFCAVGGMHADRLLKGLREQQKQGVTYNEFVRGYRGSYATAPADKFGQALQVTLSPVAGASNVLFMLSGLGLDLNNKKDPRIIEALAEVKEGEFQRGMNYRGYNNANAFLMLADKFGLREHKVFAGNKKKSKNNLQFAFRECSDDPYGGITYAAHLQLVPDTLAFAKLNQIAVSGHLDSGWQQPELDLGENGKVPTEQYYDFKVAQGTVEKAKQWLQRVDDRFAALNVLEARRFEAPVGAVHAKDGDAMNPQSEGKVGVKLIFTTGTPEKFQANGVGKNYEEAMGMAIQTMLDFKLFQIEQERKKAGQSPILTVEERKRDGSDLSKFREKLERQHREQMNQMVQKPTR